MSHQTLLEEYTDKYTIDIYKALNSLDHRELFNTYIQLGIFIFIPTIYDHFKDEYRNNKELLYTDFIKSKDLGVMSCVVEESAKMYKGEIHSDYYYITNNKKWLLSKLKYAF